MGIPEEEEELPNDPGFHLVITHIHKCCQNIILYLINMYSGHMLTYFPSHRNSRQYMISEDKSLVQHRGQVWRMSLLLKAEHGVEERHHRGSVYHLFATSSQVEVD